MVPVEKQISGRFACGGGEGFAEDGLEQGGGVGAAPRDPRLQLPTPLQQSLHPRHDLRLLPQGREGDGDFVEAILAELGLKSAGHEFGQVHPV